MSSVIDDTRRSHDFVNRQASGRQALLRLLMGWLAVVAWPAAIVLDTWRAVGHGWLLRDAGGLALIHGASLAVLVGVSLAALVGPGFRRWLQRAAARLACGSIGLLLGMAMAEMLIRLMVPMAPFHGRTPWAQYHLQPDPRVLPGVRGAARIRYDAMGRRNVPATSPPPIRANGSDSIYRIVCLGGGTTECLYLDQGETWPARLGQRLRERGLQSEMLVVARAGCASGHHIRWLHDPHRGEQPKAHCVVLLIGASDLVRAVLGLSDGRSAGPLWFQTALAYLARDVWNGRLGHGMICDPSGQWFTILRRRRHLGPFDPTELQTLLDQRIAQYGHTLETLARQANRRGQRLVLVTQPVLWDPRITPEGRRRFWLARDEVSDSSSSTQPPNDAPGRFTATWLRHAIDRFNQVLIKTATTNHVLYVDAAAAMSGRERFFYDDFHLNEAGCDALARLVAEALVPEITHRTPRLPIPTERSPHTPQSVSLSSSVARQPMPVRSVFPHPGAAARSARPPRPTEVP